MKHPISLLILLGLSQVCFANSSTPQQRMDMKMEKLDNKVVLMPHDLNLSTEVLAKLQEEYSDRSIQDDRQQAILSTLIFQKKKSNIADEIQVTDEQIANAPSHSEDGAQLDTILNYWDGTLSDTQKESFEDIKTNSRHAKTGGPCINAQLCANRKE